MKPRGKYELHTAVMLLFDIFIKELLENNLHIVWRYITAKTGIGYDVTGGKLSLVETSKKKQGKCVYKNEPI
jgi:hypothetical protein